jgi:ATP-binding cassette subfamily B protein
MSIYENIRLGKVDATRIEIEEAARQANAHDFIMLLPNVCIYYSFSLISLLVF